VNDWIDLSALWKIIVVGLLAGAGLPAVFAVGIRVLALTGERHPGAVTPDGHAGDGGILRLAVAVGCFTVVLAGVGTGIYLVVVD
jgi:hypothetical protein